MGIPYPDPCPAKLMISHPSRTLRSPPSHPGVVTGGLAGEATGAARGRRARLQAPAAVPGAHRIVVEK